MKFKNNRFLLSIITAVFLIVFSFSVGVDRKDKGEALFDEQALWNQNISEYLKFDLWENGENYDAANVLMIPMYAAFYSQDDAGLREFSEHFRRFAESDDKSFAESEPSDDLSKQQYQYLASRFLALAVQAGREDLIPAQMVEKLQEGIAILWQDKPAWWYGRDPFLGGMRERIIWKLGQSDNMKPSYYRAIIDQEMFLFASAADMRIYEIESGAAQSQLISEILDYAYLVIARYGKSVENNGWLFQPGLWEDHGDCAYAGNFEINNRIKPAPIVGIAEDSSHSHRWPVWLQSLIDASRLDRERYDFYFGLREKLENQFFNKVLVSPSNDFSCYRMNNFMDGNNGVYRYGYPTQGNNNGYGPYELSGTLIGGWWGLFGTERNNEVYRNMAKCFPLAKNVLRVYVGPNTTRPRNELVKWPNFFQNGFAQLNVNLASRIRLYE